MKNQNKGFIALIWASSDKFFTNVIALIISIILARLIDPSEFGILATASIFTILLSLFVEPGMTSALIQKKNSDKLDFSTIQTFNLFFGIILYFALFFLSNPISSWFKMPILSLVIKILGLQIVIGGINSVQVAYVQKNMMFKKYLICSIVSITFSAVIAIFMAFKGYGVWALVTYNLLKQFLITVLTFFIFKCRFGFKFSKERFREMFPFASKILFSKFIDQGYVEFTQLITSKEFSTTDLAYYNKGKSFPELIMLSINNALSSVMFPYFSELQDDKESFSSSIRNFIQLTSYICIPMMIGLCACAKNFILVILNEKWVDSVPFLQLYCVYYLFIPFSNVVQQSLKALGNSIIPLFIQIFKFVISIVSLIVLLLLLKSPIAIALSVAISYSIAFIVESIIASKFLDYKIRSIFIDMGPSLIASCLMGLGVYLIGFLNLNLIVKLLIQVIFGIIFYLVFSVKFKFPQINYIKNMFFNKKEEKNEDVNHS